MTDSHLGGPVRNAGRELSPLLGQGGCDYLGRVWEQVGLEVTEAWGHRGGAHGEGKVFVMRKERTSTVL